MIRWLFMALAFLAAMPAAADELRPGYLAMTERTPGLWLMVWKAPMQGGVTPATQPVLPDNCRTAAVTRREQVGPAMVTHATIRCAGPISGKSIGLADFGAARTDALVRIQPLGRPLQTLRLTAAAPTAKIPARADRSDLARTYFLIGVEHILFGFDHLLFVVALVLLLRGIARIAAAVTAFTVAHSLTLAGTTLGVIGLPSAPVEAVIALSILFLAVEIVEQQPGAPRLSERLPWLVAFLFGLLHGFGFAGALAEIGLPETDVPLALVMFNLGVEAGQLAIVIGAGLVLTALRRWAPAATPHVVRVVTYAIGIISGWWFVDRLAG